MKKLLIILALLPFIGFSQTYYMNATHGKSGKGSKKYNQLDHKEVNQLLKDNPMNPVIVFGGIFTTLQQDTTVKVDVDIDNGRGQKVKAPGASKVLHFFGHVNGDPGSRVRYSVNKLVEEGTIELSDGTVYVIGKIDTNTVMYNTKDLTIKNPFKCDNPQGESSHTGLQNNINISPSMLAITKGISAGAKMVTYDLVANYDVFQAKGGYIDKVNSFMQVRIFNLQNLYAAAGITLRVIHLEIKTTPTVFIGPGAGNMLTQFKDNYTAAMWHGAVGAHLVSFSAGNSGVAYTDGINKVYCDYPQLWPPQAMTGVTGMYNSPDSVPIGHWNDECLAHEIGHNLGCNHTFACAYFDAQGNRFRIDKSGYPAYDQTECPCLCDGSQTTIMGYGFPNIQMKFHAIHIQKMQDGIAANNCLPYVSGCLPPAQPSTITGYTAGCTGAKITYSVSPVNGASSYSWTLPNTWSGSSTTNTIIATVGNSFGQVKVRAVNSCGVSPERFLDVNYSNCNPCYPKSEIGSKPCPQGQTGTINYTLSYTCINGVLTPGDTIWTYNCTTVNKDSVKINCTIQEVLFSTGLSKYVKVFPTGATNYSYKWLKNGVLQTWKTQIIYSNNYTQYKRGDVLKVIVGSTNATYNGKPIKAGEATIIVK